MLRRLEMMDDIVATKLGPSSDNLPVESICYLLQAQVA